MEIVVINLVLALGYIFILLNFKKGWKNIPVFIMEEKDEDLPMVSIVIAARNEEEHISMTLDAILAQTYPKHLVEVIVINDHSEDQTANIVASYGEAVKLINFLDPAKINSYKKAAIALAIAEAKGKLIVTTDADCIMGTHWLKTLVRYQKSGSYKMVSAPVAYHKERSFFERLQSIEFSFLIGMGASTIGNKMPTTCNGANLMYQKEIFTELGGFKGIDHKASGDDELLLHKVAEIYPEGIGFVKAKDAVVYTYAKANLSDFIAQRKRWASKSTSYKSRFIIFIGVWLWLFNAAIFGTALYLLFNLQLLPWLLGIIMVKVAVDFNFINPTLQFFKKDRYAWMVPILSLVHILYFVYIGLAGNLGSYRWKGRTVK